jgi:hypothetical protein
MRRCRWPSIGATLLLALAPVGAAAESACDQSAVRDALARLSDALGKPRAQAAMQAAEADYAADQRFDDEDDVRYLAAAALYVKAKDDLDAGAVDDACALLQNAGKLIAAVIAGR